MKDPKFDPPNFSVQRSTFSVQRSGGMAAGPAAVDAGNPWPGLSSFTEETRGFFYGREKETDELSRLVRRETLTVLFGQSGLGKSSLLQAGLFPLLRENDHLPLYLRLDHDLNAAPLAEQVKAALNAAFVETKADAPPLGPSESLWEYFHRKDVDIWSAKNRLLTPVLAFDQFEEIFTLGRADDARRERSRAFLSELAGLVENRAPAELRDKFDHGQADPTRYNFDKPSCRVILSLREDFLPDLEGLKQELPALVHNRLRLKRLNGAQALEAVVRPAPELLAPEVGEKIVEFVSGTRGGSAERLFEMEVEPALLSVICRELNERRRTLGQEQITADLVSGNRREILTDFYERSVADLPEEMRRFVEDHLLTKSGFRDNIALETALERPGVTRPLLDILVARRLLRLEERAGVHRVELTHDVLADVVRASRDSRQQRSALERESRQTRRIRWIAIGLGLGLAAVCMVTLHSRRVYHQELRRSSGTDVSVASREFEDGRSAEGLAHLVRAARKDPHNPIIAPRIASYLESRNFLVPEGATHRQPTAVFWTKYLDDGKTLGVLWQDGTYGVIDTATGEIEKVQLPSAPMKRQSIFPTRHFLAVHCRDGIVRVLNAAGRVVHELSFESGVEGATRVASGSANTDLILLALKNNTVVLCDAATGRTIGDPIVPEGTNTWFALSDDWLVWTGGHIPQTRLSRFVYVRNTKTGALQVTLNSQFGIFDALPSPTGRQVVTTQRESESNVLFIRRWSLPEGTTLGEPSPIDATMPTGGWPYYTPDGRYIVTWYRVLEAWDADTGARTGMTQTSSRGASEKPIFSPDNVTLALTSNIGVLELWNVATGKPKVASLPHTGKIDHVAFNADGSVVMTLATDGSVRIWNTTTGGLLAEPAAQRGYRSKGVVAPNGSELALGTSDGRISRHRVWQGAAGSLDLPRRKLSIGTFLPDSPSTFALHRVDGINSHLDLNTGKHETIRPTFPARLAESGGAGSGLGGGAGNALRMRADARVMIVRTATYERQVWWQSNGKIERVVPFAQSTGNIDGTTRLVKFSASADRALVVTTRQIEVWDLQTGKLVGPPVPSNGITYVDFSPDGARLVSPPADPDEGINIWNVVAGKADLQLGVESARSEIMQFSPDGSRVATANSAGEAHLWDAQNGQQIGPAMVHSGNIAGIVFSPDSRLLATFSGDGVLQVWDARKGGAAGERLENRATGFHGARFSADGAKLVTTSGAADVRVWDLHSFQPLTEPLMHPEHRVWIADFSPDGRFVRTEPWGPTPAFRIFSIPEPLPDRATTPRWLLDLAVVFGGRTLSDDGKLLSADENTARLDAIRQHVMSLPETAPYAAWGRWFLSEDRDRPIAAGFTLTAAAAKKIHDELAGAAPAPAGSAP